MLSITPIPAFTDNYIWMLANTQSRQALIVDPGQAQPVLHALAENKYTLAGILVTHHHYDHTGGIADILNQMHAPVYGPVGEEIPLCTHPLNENDKISFPTLDLTMTILEIPGHTKGHIAYLFDQYLFCGDTLFTGGCGRIFEGTPIQMYESLQKLAALPTNTQVYCAHEYTENNLRFAQLVEPENHDLKQRIKMTADKRKQNLPTVPSTIALELATNPFLRCDQPTVVQAAEITSHQSLENDPIAVFTQLRNWKNAF